MLAPLWSPNFCIPYGLAHPSLWIGSCLFYSLSRGSFPHSSNGWHMALTYKFSAALISPSCFISVSLSFLEDVSLHITKLSLPVSFASSIHTSDITSPFPAHWANISSQLSNLSNPPSVQKRKPKLWKDWPKIIQH